MKKLIIIGASLAVVIGIIVVTLLGNLDGIVKSTIEKVGTKVLGVEVSVDGVTIGLTDGLGQISGLRIANPEGYKDAYAFEMNLVRLKINIGSLGKSPIVIDEIIVDKPIANVQVDNKGKSNLDAIKTNLASGGDKPKKVEDKEEVKEEGTEESSSGEAVAIAVGKLYINGVTFNLTRPKGEETETTSGTLPTVSMENIGGTTGVTPDYLANEILSTLINAILKEALAGSIKESLFGGIKGKL